jgi:protein O-mannosyl-transferase
MATRNRKHRGSSPAGAAILPVATASGWRPQVVVALTAICVVTALAYLPAISGGMLWDDDAHVTKPELRSLAGLYRIWFELGATQQYYPLLHSFFWLEHKLWGDSVVGYHLANLGLHIAAACLVYVVLQRLKVPGALLAAAIFALHPVQVESVAWISEQKNTLSAVFYLSAMPAYLRFDESRGRRDYWIALTLFLLGLLTKTVIATLPAAMLVIFWWQRGKLSWRRDVAPLVPFFLVGAAAGALTAWIERTLIGASGINYELSPLQRGLLAGRVIWFYLGKLVWPTNLIFIYPRWNVDPAVWWQWLYSVATLAVLVGFWAIRRRWRSPLASWLLFTGTLFPVLGFLNVYPFLFSFVADHFQYLACLGVFALAAAILEIAVGRLPASSRGAGHAAIVALLGILALLTWQQSKIYSDAATLYQATLDRNPNCWMAHNNFGTYQSSAGRYQDAIDHFNAALRLKSDYPGGHDNLGIALARLGRYQAAIEEHRMALKLQPDFAEAYSNLGIALFASGARAEAMEHFHEALKLKPSFPDARNNLGNALLVSGQYAEAIPEFERSLELNPNSTLAENNLGEALRLSGRAAEAITHYQNGLRLGPEYPEIYYRIALCYSDLNQSADAIATAEKALKLARSAGNTATMQEIQAWRAAYVSKQHAASSDQKGGKPP